MAGNEQIRIDIDAKDNASDVIADVAGEVAELEDRKVEVPVRAELDEKTIANAQAALEKLEGKAKAAGEAMEHMGDGAGKGGEALAQSAGPMRDVSGAMGNMGVGALDAGEGIMGLGETLGTISPKLAGLGTGLMNAGFAAAAIGLAVAGADAAIKKLLDTEGRMREATGDMTGSVQDSAAAFHDYRKALEDANSLFDVFKRQATGLAGAIPAVSDALSVGTTSLEAFNKLLTDSPGAARALLTNLNELGTASGLSQEEIAELNAAMTDHVAAARAAAEGTETLAVEQRSMAERVQAATDAIEAQKQAQLDAFGAQIDAADATIALAEANRHLEETFIATEAARAAHDPAALEAAIRDERDAAIDAAKAQLDLASAQATATGTSLTAAQKADALNRSLIESARYATPEARAQIVGYIADLNGIPPDKATAIVANADTDAAVRDLNNAANPNGRPRDAYITPRLTGSAQDLFRQAGFGGAAVAYSLPAPAATTVNVTMNMPRGSRPGDVMAAVNRYARHNGRRR